MWKDKAACAGTDMQIWFPEDLSGPWRPISRARAQAVCGWCPVRADCLREAMGREADRERYGIWGGLTPKERAALAKHPAWAAWRAQTKGQQ